MSKAFIPRDWQERFVRQYQANPKKNTLLEACTAAGKTNGATYVFDALKTTLDWKLIIVVTPSEHLRKQYAHDAHRFFNLKLYYSGTDTRIQRLPSPEELLKAGYQGLVVSYQWLTKPKNARELAEALKKSIAGKVFVILDEVHHASHELSFGQACEIAFPDHLVSHRLMTTGTPFRSDNNKILGNWLSYEQIDENSYECRPDFHYTLADARQDGIIPLFSFVTLEGEFKYIRNQAVYDGQTFKNATTEQQLKDALNTAISIDGDWVKEAILWAYNRMKRDRAKGLPECATYVRVSGIPEARKMKERIKSLTGENALVVVSKEDDDTNSNTNFKFKGDPSKLIEKFAAETGVNACSWIIGVKILGEGVSINRLKYRIHATNVCALLSFIQDLGRLLRLFPSQALPEPAETLIPAHPLLIEYATNILNQIAHVVNDLEEIDDDDDNEEAEGGLGENEEPDSSSLNFIPLTSTGEMGAQIVDGEEIETEYANVAEWAIENKEFGKTWSKTPAHFAQMLLNDEGLFKWLYNEYQQAVNLEPSLNTPVNEATPLGFPSDYLTKLPDEKANYARRIVSKKVNHLVFLLYPKAEGEEQKEHIKKVYTIAKLRNGIPTAPRFISYQGWEKIYLWLLDRIAHAQDLKGTEDL